MEKPILKKLIKTYEKRLLLRIKERECIDVEIDGLSVIVKKLGIDLEELEELEKVEKK